MLVLSGVARETRHATDQDGSPFASDDIAQSGYNGRESFGLVSMVSLFGEQVPYQSSSIGMPEQPTVVGESHPIVRR
jgi:hypothetical protein